MAVVRIFKTYFGVNFSFR